MRRIFTGRLILVPYTCLVGPKKLSLFLYYSHFHNDWLFFWGWNKNWTFDLVFKMHWFNVFLQRWVPTCFLFSPKKDKYYENESSLDVIVRNLIQTLCFWPVEKTGSPIVHLSFLFFFIFLSTSIHNILSSTSGCSRPRNVTENKVKKKKKPSLQCDDMVCESRTHTHLHTHTYTCAKKNKVQ